MGTARCPLTTTFDFFLYNFLSFSIVLCHIFQYRVNFIERKNIKINKRTSYIFFSFIYLIYLLNKTHIYTYLNKHLYCRDICHKQIAPHKDDVYFFQNKRMTCTQYLTIIGNVSLEKDFAQKKKKEVQLTRFQRDWSSPRSVPGQIPCSVYFAHVSRQAQAAQLIAPLDGVLHVHPGERIYFIFQRISISIYLRHLLLSINITHPSPFS